LCREIIVLANDLLNHYRQISQQPLTIIDVETTGSMPRKARVIEISLLQASLTEGILSQQTDLVNPRVWVPPSITQFTGITQAMVATAPPATEVWPKYHPPLQEGILTAHNLSFDYGFVQSELQRLSLPFSRPVKHQFCTVKLSRLLLSELPSRSLPNLVKHFQFPIETSHRAEADTLACWFLAKYLLTRIQNDSDEELLDRFAKEWLPLPKLAQLLQCEPSEAWQRLDQSGVPWRHSRSTQTYLYPRGAVERLIAAEERVSSS
jgi:DNA polymerase-3 subunit epsilon